MTENRPIPLPSPQTPVSGLAKHDAEMRRRIMADLLPHSHGAITSKDDLLDIASWVENGDDEGES